MRVMSNPLPGSKAAIVNAIRRYFARSPDYIREVACPEGNAFEFTLTTNPTFRSIAGTEEHIGWAQARHATQSDATITLQPRDTSKDPTYETITDINTTDAILQRWFPEITPPPTPPPRLAPYTITEYCEVFTDDDAKEIAQLIVAKIDRRYRWPNPRHYTPDILRAVHQQLDDAIKTAIRGVINDPEHARPERRPAQSLMDAIDRVVQIACAQNHVK